MLVATTYYDFVAMALDDSHTDESLIKLGEKAAEFSQTLLGGLLSPLHNKWRYPKQHLMNSHLLHARREMGQPGSYSTAPFEHKHQPFKEDYSLGSNNNRRDQTLMRTEIRYRVFLAFSQLVSLPLHLLRGGRGRELRRPESAAKHQGRVSHRSWYETGNTMQTRDASSVSFTSLTNTVRGLITELWEEGGIPDAAELLATSKIQYFKQLNLAQGDSAGLGDRAVILMSNEDGDETQEFVELNFFFRVTGPLLVRDDVPTTLLALCLVNYFTPVHQVILKKTHRHASDLSKAKGRLTSPLISTRKSLYVTFAEGNGPRPHSLIMASSVIRRSRFWYDSTQTGAFSCFYADV